MFSFRLFMTFYSQGLEIWLDTSKTFVFSSHVVFIIRLYVYIFLLFSSFFLLFQQTNWIVKMRARKKVSRHFSYFRLKKKKTKNKKNVENYLIWFEVEETERFSCFLFLWKQLKLKQIYKSFATMNFGFRIANYYLLSDGHDMNKRMMLKEM